MQRGQGRGRLHHRTRRAILKRLFAAAAAGRYPERDQLFLALVFDEGLPLTVIGQLMGVHIKAVPLRSSPEVVLRNIRKRPVIPIPPELQERFAEFVYLYIKHHAKNDPFEFQLRSVQPMSLWTAEGLVREEVPIDLHLTTIEYLKAWLRVRALTLGKRNPLHVMVRDIDEDLEDYLRAGIPALFVTERGQTFTPAAGYALLRTLTKRAGLDGQMPAIHLLQARPLIRDRYLREPKTKDWARAAAKRQVALLRNLPTHDQPGQDDDNAAPG